MGTNFVHRDEAGFRTWSLNAPEFSAVAAWLVLGLESADKGRDIGGLTDALSLASYGIGENRKFWLIERTPGGIVAVAHGAAVPTGGPRFDGLAWLAGTPAGEPAPFGTPAGAICSVADFCRRFVGYSSPGETPDAPVPL